jgi:hypothetical protein
MTKMKNFTKMNNRIVLILFLGVMLSGVSFAKEPLPLTDKRQNRLKNETRIFNQFGSQKKSSVFARKDTFVDNNKDGINDRLSKEKDSSPLFQFLNDKVSSSLSKEKVNKEASAGSNVKSIPEGQIRSVESPKKIEKTVERPAQVVTVQPATAKTVIVKKPVPLKVKIK